MTPDPRELWDRDTFIARLREVGDAKYRAAHPMIVEIDAGRAAPAVVKSWIANRYYLQSKQPCYDGLILARCPVRDVRRVWLERIMEHDGRRAEQGAISGWMQLAEAAGMARRDLEENRQLLPEVRTAVDEQMELVVSSPWQAGVATSLAEWVSPDLLREPIGAVERHYTWIEPAGLAYFKTRPGQMARNTTYALECTVKYCDTPDLQRQAVATLERQCEILWSMLDAIAAQEPQRRASMV